MVEDKQEVAEQAIQLPKLCKNVKISGHYALASLHEGEKVLVPITSVAIKTEFRGLNASTNVEISYVNPTKENPLECSYSLPLEKSSFLAKFEATLDGKVIQTKIQDKQRA